MGSDRFTLPAWAYQAIVIADVMDETWARCWMRPGSQAAMAVLDRKRARRLLGIVVGAIAAGSIARLLASSEPLRTSARIPLKPRYSSEPQAITLIGEIFMSGTRSDSHAEPSCRTAQGARLHRPDEPGSRVTWTTSTWTRAARPASGARVERPDTAAVDPGRFVNATPTARSGDRLARRVSSRIARCSRSTDRSARGELAVRPSSPARRSLPWARPSRGARPLVRDHRHRTVRLHADAGGGDAARARHEPARQAARRARPAPSSPVPWPRPPHAVRRGRRQRAVADHAGTSRGLLAPGGSSPRADATASDLGRRQVVLNPQPRSPGR